MRTPCIHQATLAEKTGTLPRTYCDGLLDEYRVYV
jgi:hypothetical protein